MSNPFYDLSLAGSHLDAVNLVAGKTLCIFCNLQSWTEMVTIVTSLFFSFGANYSQKGNNNK